jgi:hypothetical protein
VQGGFLPEGIGAGLTLAILFVLSQAQLRHLGLALAVVFLPLPGAILAAWLGIPEFAPAYLCGFLLANVLAAQIAAKICDEDSPSHAIKDASWGAFPFLIWPAALALCMSVLPPILSGNVRGLLPAGCLALSCISVLVLPPAARILSFDGAFVTRTNRAREAWDRGLNRLTFVVQPRWGWSVSGIGLIFTVLGIFGGAVQFVPFDGWIAASTAVLFVAVAYLATRDLRRTVALCLSIAILFCVACWTGCRLVLEGRDLWLPFALAAFPALIMASRSAAFARDGDNAAVATLRSFEMLAEITVFFCLGAAIAMLALGPIAGAVLALCGSVAALLLFPALTAAIFDLFPPRVSLDAYRAR